jgi:hypothetical protein
MNGYSTRWGLEYERDGAPSVSAGKRSDSITILPPVTLFPSLSNKRLDMFR